MTFTDFDSTFAQVRRIAKSQGKEGRAWFAQNGVDPDSYESVYSEELKRSLKLKDPLCKMRLAAELISALRILAREIQSDDGVAAMCIAEAADRIEELLLISVLWAENLEEIRGVK